MLCVISLMEIGNDDMADGPVTEIASGYRVSGPHIASGMLRKCSTALSIAKVARGLSRYRWWNT